jgi:prephenate dehydrogenase
MWRDICIANRDRLLVELTRFSKKMLQLRKQLQKKKAKSLENTFLKARSARERWLKQA